MKEVKDRVGLVARSHHRLIKAGDQMLDILKMYFMQRTRSGERMRRSLRITHVDAMDGIQLADCLGLFRQFGQFRLRLSVAPALTVSTKYLTYVPI